MGRHGGSQKRMLDHIGWDAALHAAELPQPGSNRGYAPEQLVNQFMHSVWSGANRVEHLEVTRFDATLGKIFGYEKMANYKALTRLLDKFDQATIETVFPSLYQHLFDQVGLQTLTLDLESIVLTRYGFQQGALRGYNPSKRGRASHHPLMAFVADSRMLANVELRPGNAHTANNAIAFLQSSIHNLGAKKRVGLVRADSGFCEKDFLEHLENKDNKLNYVVALKMIRPMQHRLVSAPWLPQQDTDESGKPTQDVPGIELCEFEYQAESWYKPRRVIGIRQHIKKRLQAKGKILSLFDNDTNLSEWRYGAIVTDLAVPTVEVWRTYRGRADCENRIKELKYDLHWTLCFDRISGPLRLRCTGSCWHSIS